MCIKSVSVTHGLRPSDAPLAFGLPYRYGWKPSHSPFLGLIYFDVPTWPLGVGGAETAENSSY
jgi:hypothetical protein